MVLDYILSIIMGAASFFSNEFLNKFEEHKNKFASFTIGLATVYVFLQLLPEAYIGINKYGIGMFLTTLIGFSIFHIGERLIAKYGKKQKIKKNLEYLHLIIFLFYHIVVGIVLVDLLHINIISGILFSGSLSFIYLTTTALFEDLHAKGKHVLSKRIFSASSFLIGVIIANTGIININFLYLALGFVSGVLIYIIGKEILPQYKASNALFFSFGILIYSIFILTLHYYGLI